MITCAAFPHVVLRHNTAVPPAPMCSIPPCAVPAPTFEAVKKFKGIGVFRGVGRIGVIVPAVADAAVPFADCVTEQATEQ